MRSAAPLPLIPPNQLLIPRPNLGRKLASARGDGGLIQRKELAITHQQLPGNDSSSDHALVKAEEDMPGEVAR